jgi:hypothetical protein
LDNPVESTNSIEHHCEATNFAALVEGEQVFGLGVALVKRQDLPRQRRHRRAVTTIESGHCAIEQFIDRSALVAGVHRAPSYPELAKRVSRANGGVFGNFP